MLQVIHKDQAETSNVKIKLLMWILTVYDQLKQNKLEKKNDNFYKEKPPNECSMEARIRIGISW